MASSVINKCLLRSYISFNRSTCNYMDCIGKRQIGKKYSANIQLNLQHKRNFVQAMKKIYNKDNKELNDMEEQAYGCTENAQYTRALHVFEQLIDRDPNCARYYFDYGLTIIRYIDNPPSEMIDDAQKYFQKAVELAPNESRIIKSYGSLLFNAMFNDKEKCIKEANELFNGYIDRTIISKNKELSEFTMEECKLIDCDILFLYGQLLDDKCRDYIYSKEIFEKCIYIASKSELHYEKIDEYRLRYGFYLYKQQEFDLAIEQFNIITQNYKLQIDTFNRDPNEGLDKKDRIHMNNYLIRRRPQTLNHIFANMYLGVIYNDLCEYDKSIKYFEQMMSYKDKFYVKDNHQIQIMMLNEYILHLIKIGDFEQAHENWMESYRLDKLLSHNAHSKLNYLGTHNFDVLTIGGHLFSEKGLKKKSNRYFKNLMKMVESIPDQHLDKHGYQNPYYFYGLHCLRMEQYKLAKESFLKLSKMHPYFPEFLYQLSVSCAKLKQYDESKKYLKQAMDMNFRMIYPKYFAHADNIFAKIDIKGVIPQEKLAMIQS